MMSVSGQSAGGVLAAETLKGQANKPPADAIKKAAVLDDRFADGGGGGGGSSPNDAEVDWREEDSRGGAADLDFDIEAFGRFVQERYSKPTVDITCGHVSGPVYTNAPIPDRGGWDADLFIPDLPREFSCPICMCSLHDAVMHSETTTCIFCRACVSRHLAKSARCPMCNVPLNTKDLRNAPLIFQKMIDRLDIRCPYSIYGCDYNTSVGSVGEHLDVCEYSPICCTYCGTVFMRKDSAEHYGKCLEADVTCQNCYCYVKRRDMPLHQSVCPVGAMLCTCGVRIPNSTVSHHREVECPSSLIPCSVPGCDDVMQNTAREIYCHANAHLGMHLALLYTSVLAQRRLVQSLKRKMEEMQKQVSDAEGRLKAAELAARDDIVPSVLLPGSLPPSQPIPADGRPADIGSYGRIRVGSLVTIQRHRAVQGVDNWCPEMDEFVGKQAVVRKLAGVDSTGCVGVFVTVADREVRYFFRARDLALVSERQQSAGGIVVGSKVRLKKHEMVNGSSNWSSAMDQYVGMIAVVAAIGAVDGSGCPGVYVTINNVPLKFFWRIASLELISDR